MTTKMRDVHRRARLAKPTEHLMTFEDEPQWTSVLDDEGRGPMTTRDERGVS